MREWTNSDISIVEIKNNFSSSLKDTIDSNDLFDALRDDNSTSDESYSIKYIDTSTNEWKGYFIANANENASIFYANASALGENDSSASTIDAREVRLVATINDVAAGTLGFEHFVGGDLSL